MKRRIHCVIFHGKQELPFRDHHKAMTRTENRRTVVITWSDYHLWWNMMQTCTYQLFTSKVFIGTWSTEQLDKCCCRCGKWAEIRKAHFVALMLDKTSDVRNTAQLLLVLRFVSVVYSCVRERNIHLRMWQKKRKKPLPWVRGGIWIQWKTCSPVLWRCCSYEGTAFMALLLNEVLAKVKEKIPRALVIHCYAQALNLVLSQGGAKLENVKFFTLRYFLDC